MDRGNGFVPAKLHKHGCVLMTDATRRIEYLGDDFVYVSGRKRAVGEMNGKSSNLNNCLSQIYPPGIPIPPNELVCIFDADQVSCSPLPLSPPSTTACILAYSLGCMEYLFLACCEIPNPRGSKCMTLGV